MKGILTMLRRPQLFTLLAALLQDALGLLEDVGHLPAFFNS